MCGANCSRASSARVLVIPQAITFAYLVGLPPETGLYCAVFVGLAASLFGNSAMVGGPNTAVSILLSLTVMPFAGRGSPLYMEFVLALSLMVGVIQLGIWLLRGAEIFRYFSPAAIIGIKTGVGVLLITSAVEGSLGLSPLSTQFFYEKFYLAAVSWQRPGQSVLRDDRRRHHRDRPRCCERFWPRTYIIAAVVAGSLVGAVICVVQGPVAAQVELLGHVTFAAAAVARAALDAAALAVRAGGRSRGHRDRRARPCAIAGDRARSQGARVRQSRSREGSLRPGHREHAEPVLLHLRRLGQLQPHQRRAGDGCAHAAVRHRRGRCGRRLRASCSGRSSPGCRCRRSPVSWRWWASA